MEWKNRKVNIEGIGVGKFDGIRSVSMAKDVFRYVCPYENPKAIIISAFILDRINDWFRSINYDFSMKSGTASWGTIFYVSNYAQHSEYRMIGKDKTVVILFEYDFPMKIMVK